jgi:hypothetical protein
VFKNRGQISTVQHVTRTVDQTRGRAARLKITHEQNLWKDADKQRSFQNDRRKQDVGTRRSLHEAFTAQG